VPGLDPAIIFIDITHSFDRGVREIAFAELPAGV
jgi:hypothetical protein